MFTSRQWGNEYLSRTESSGRWRRLLREGGKRENVGKTKESPLLSGNQTIHTRNQWENRDWGWPTVAELYIPYFLPFFLLLVFWPLEELIGVWNQSEVGANNPGSLEVDTNLSNFTSDSCNGSDGHPLNFYKWFSKSFLSKAWGRGTTPECWGEHGGQF